MASGMINQKHTIGGAIKAASAMSGSTSAGGGSTDHSRLYNRDADDQHPISAITDLQDALDEKLDSETALPLIEEAVKYKAKGLYYDANKELATKSYWYLTSEIDSATGQGTKASVISGPYDLGAGGGSGGGVTTVTISSMNPETGESLWPSAVALEAECKIGVYWTSKRDTEATGGGTMFIYVNDELAIKQAVQQGVVYFDITKYIVSGSNKIEAKVTDAYSTTKNLIGNISGVTLKLTSSFEDDVNYTGPITYTYIPWGDIAKTVHFIVDGTDIGTEVIKTTGEQCTRIIPAQSHGAHSLQVYFTAVLSGETVTSNTLSYDLITYEEGRTEPIIASTYAASSTQEQYVAVSLPYRVYTPNRNISTVELYINGVKQGESLEVDTAWQKWEWRPMVIGAHTLLIKTGSVSRAFQIAVTETTIDVEPVTQNQVLYLSSIGRSNKESAEARKKWEDTDHSISCELSGFNWTSNGWVADESGNTALKLSGDARVVIPYKVFENDFQQSGKTIEIELATSDVKQYESRIVECLTGGDSLTYSYSLAGEDDRSKYFEVTAVDQDKFIAKVKGEHRTYMFIYSSGNWTLDGEIVDLSDDNEYGITIVKKEREGTASEYFIDGDKITVSYLVVGRGFYVTPQLAKFQSQLSALSTQYKENEMVRLSFVIEKRTENRLIYMYINGIMSGVTRYPTGDVFIQNPPADITIGSNNATVSIYTIRIYDNSLTRKQIVNNWIADTRDIVSKSDRYYDNNNYDDTGKIVISKLPAKTPYMILTGENLPSAKKDKRLVDIEFVYPGSDERYYTSPEATIDVQGTSSQYYYRKNFKIKHDNGFYDINGDYSKKYKIIPPLAKKEKTFTYKADVASSEGANNVELVKYFEDTKNFYVPPELDQDPEDTQEGYLTADRVRVGINGFPIVMFHNDGTSTSFYGKMNFNNDKGNDDTFGFTDGDESWEITNNNNKLVLFQDDDMSIWRESFESRYPETVEEAGGGEHNYGEGEGELDKLTAVVKWIVSTMRKDTDTEEEKAAKLNKFKTELENYFDVDSSLFYYLYTELFLMVDSRAKNAMLTYYRSHNEGDGGNKWFWIPYDMDTAIGTNNEGLLLFDYDVEDTDIINGAAVYNGQYSTFWNNIRDAFPDELQEMYTDLRSGNTAGKGGEVAWTYDIIEKRYEEHQAFWSANIFNEDSYVKYLEPLVKNNDATYLGMAQGSKAEQRKWWLYNRFKYLDSKYMAGDAKSNTIMLRAYQKSDFEVTPYINCYVTAIFDQATAANVVGPTYAERDVAIDIISPEHWDPKGTDSVVVLYSADELRDIGDISGFKAGYADFSAATKLQKLQIGSSDVLYKNEKLTGINVGANHLLTYLDARNCTNLGEGEGSEVTPVIDLTNCYSIEETYFDNTRIKGVSFPVGGNLKKVHLPESITDLTIRSHPSLEELELAGLETGATNNLTSVWLEDIPSSTINAIDLVNTMADNSLVRLINIDETVSSVTEIEAFYTKLDKMKGKDAKGDTTTKAQVTGKIAVPVISYKKYVDLSAKYPEIIINAGQIMCTVTFMNDSTEFNTQIVVQGENANNPGTPHRASTAQYYYTFAQWDQSYENVQTDLTIYAEYSATTQIYTVKFDLQTQLVDPIPDQQVEYNTCVVKPDDPCITGAEFNGWFKEATTINKFDFDVPVTGPFIPDEDDKPQPIILYAKWTDYDHPNVEISPETFKRFKYTLTDNIAVTAYAITTSTETPTEWTEITPASTYEGTYEISAAGTYYIWAKDASEKTGKQQVTAYSIYKQAATGTEIITKQGEEASDDFCLYGITLKVTVNLDSHYENFKIYIDGTEPADYSDIKITVIKDYTISTVCSPKSYTVTFDTHKGTEEWGTSIGPQTIVYGHKATRPSNQYDRYFIMSGWYREKELINEWDFDTDTVSENMTLYVKWIRYTEPTRYTVIVNENTGLDFACYLTQTVPYGVKVNFGDGSADMTVPGEALAPNLYKAEFVHTYSEYGTYYINVTCLEGLHYLGLDYSFQAVMPSLALTDIKFAYSMPYTNEYAFRGAISLTTINLTDYMTKISRGMFQECTSISELTIPDNIIEIDDNAFNRCENLSTINWSTNIESIGQSAFYGCYNLTEFEVPPKVNVIRYYCFAVSGLQSIDIPEHVTEIEGYAFAASSIRKIILRNKDLKMGDCAFNWCSNLTSAGPIGGDYSIEFAWDTKIPDYAFAAGYLQSDIKTIVLPNTITEIGEYAFYCCGALTSINIPTGLKKIGAYAFNRCNNLLYNIDNPLNIPATCTYIGKCAFTWCSAFQVVNIYPPINTCKAETEITGPFYCCISGLVLHIPRGIATPEDARNVYGQCWNFYGEGLELTYYNDLD